MMPSYTAPTSASLKDSKYEIVDLRSDTVSRPTPAMRQAMFDAVVGDDVFGEDPTVNLLEERVAKLFEKEAAIFLPTGTCGNVIAVLAHCDRRGGEIIVGDQSHVFLYEQGAPAQLGGIHTRTVPNLPDGTFDLKAFESCIRGDDLHAPHSDLAVVENTHNMCGGKVLPMSWLNELAVITRKYGISLHMDGARIFNASVYLGIPVAEIARDMDSVQFCFSKGLGTPAGSMLVGTQQFIKRARRLRKVLGSGMRQVGVLAAPCLVALDSMIERLAEDHRRARNIALGIAELNTDIVHVDVEGLHTNILMVYLPTKFPATTFCTRLVQVSERESRELGEDAVLVRVSPRNLQMVRIVLYWEITDEQVRKVVRKIQFIVAEFLGK